MEQGQTCWSAFQPTLASRVAKLFILIQLNVNTIIVKTDVVIAQFKEKAVTQKQLITTVSRLTFVLTIVQRGLHCDPLKMR